MQLLIFSPSLSELNKYQKMKKTFNYKKNFVGILVLSVILFNNGLVYSNQIKPSIVGSWCMEEEPEQKMVFTSDGKMKKYIDSNQLYKTYNWTLTYETTPSGIQSGILELVNVQNLNDKYFYVVTTLSTEYLGIANAKSGNLQPTTYKRIE